MTSPFLKARVKRKTIPQLYRFIAPFHDGLALIVERKARDRLLAEAQIENGDDILEVAVGTGLNLPRIVNSNPDGHTFGVDITSAMLKRAKSRMRKFDKSTFTLQFGDAFDLPFESASFDLLINSYMFDLLSAREMQKVLKEFRRVLRPGGHLALAYMYPGVQWYEKLWDGLYRIHPFILGGCRGVTAVPYLEAAEFDLSERIRISYRTFPSEVVLATAR